MKFEEFGFEERICEALDYMKFESATPIQEQAIPIIQNGLDLLACAQTGTGKTAAFMLPILNALSKEEHTGTKALVLVPTRELAIQIDQQVHGFSYFSNVESIAIYGGGSGMDHVDQRRALKSGTDIVVATPGKLISYLNSGAADFSTLKYVVLDEADQMLDIGFYDDIIRIFSHLPSKRQGLMFSATMPDNIRKLSKQILVNPEEISIALSKPAEGVLQYAYLVYDNQKIDLLLTLIKGRDELESVVVFASTKVKVSEIARTFKQKGIKVASISSNLEQKEREDVIAHFKARNLQVLVATDVISRGIDIKGINLVVNYDVPQDAEDYVHRVGRTARADESGLAITLINPEDMFRFKKIEELIEREIPKSPPPPDLGQGPEWKVRKASGRKFQRRRR